MGEAESAFNKIVLCVCWSAVGAGASFVSALPVLLLSGGMSWKRGARHPLLIEHQDTVVLFIVPAMCGVFVGYSQAFASVAHAIGGSISFGVFYSLLITFIYGR